MTKLFRSFIAAGLASIMALALLCSCGAASSAPASPSQSEPPQLEATTLTVSAFSVSANGAATLAFVDEAGEDFLLPPAPEQWFANAVFLRAEAAPEDAEALSPTAPDYSSLGRLYYVFSMEGEDYRILLCEGAAVTVVRQPDGLYAALDESWQPAEALPRLEPVSTPPADSEAGSGSGSPASSTPQSTSGSASADDSSVGAASSQSGESSAGRGGGAGA